MAEGYKYCRQCGAQNAKAAKFCISCGTAFDSAPSGAPEPSETTIPAQKPARKRAAAKPDVKRERSPKQAAKSDTGNAGKKEAKKESAKKEVPKRNGGCLKTVVMIGAFVLAVWFLKDRFGNRHPYVPAVQMPKPAVQTVTGPASDNWEYSKAQYENAPVYTSAISAEEPTAQCGDVRVEMQPWMFAEDDEIKVTELPEITGEASGYKVKRYDVSLSSGAHEFGTDVAVCIPREENETYHYAYYDPETKKHEILFSEPSEDGLYDRVYISHFSGIDKILTEGLSEEAAGTVTDNEGKLKGGLFHAKKGSAANPRLWEIGISENDLFAGYINYANPELYQHLITNIKGEIPKNFDNKSTMAESLLGHGGAATGVFSLIERAELLGEVGDGFSQLGIVCTLSKYVDLGLEAAAGGSINIDPETAGIDGAGVLLTLGGMALGSEAAVPVTIASLGLYLAGNKPDQTWNYKEQMTMGTLAFPYGPCYALPAELITSLMEQGGKSGLKFRAPECSVYFDGRGWGQLFDAIYRACEEHPEKLALCVSEACEWYARCAVTVSDEDRNAMIQRFVQIQQMANPSLFYEQMSAEEKELAVAKIRDYMIYNLRPIIKEMTKKYNREMLKSLAKEMDEILVPRLNAHVYVEVESESSDNLANDPYVNNLIRTRQDTVAGSTFDTSGGVLIDFVWDGNPVFKPNNTTMLEYRSVPGVFRPEIPRSGKTVFDCTLYHYLMMGQPGKLRFPALLDPLTQGELQPAKDLSIQSLLRDEKGEYHAVFRLESSPEIFGTWNGDWPFVYQDGSYDLISATITLQEAPSGQLRWGFKAYYGGEEMAQTVNMGPDVYTLSGDRQTIRLSQGGNTVLYSLVDKDHMRVRMRTGDMDRDFDFYRITDAASIDALR